jgi:dihydroneopterin aldolase
MHNGRTRPSSENIVADIAASFQRAIIAADRHNFAAENLIFDMGIGFGTTPTRDLEMIARLRELTNRFPGRIVIGASRKSLMEALGESVPADRLTCTLAATLSAYLNGCAIFRVHDVKENFDVLILPKPYMNNNIFLDNLEFLAKHGLRDFEMDSMQNFLISIRIFGDFLAATRSDKIADTLDYSDAYDVIKRTIERNKFQIIERLAGEIAANIFVRFSKANYLEIVVKKYPSSWAEKKYRGVGFSAKFSR